MDTSKQISIEEGNRLIAEFMQLQKCTDPSHADDPCYVVPYAKGYHKSKDMQFHLSWDWLMPIVEKIGKLYDEASDTWFKIDQLKITESIKSVYNHVIHFVQWYQSNKQL